MSEIVLKESKDEAIINEARKTKKTKKNWKPNFEMDPKPRPPRVQAVFSGS